MLKPVAAARRKANNPSLLGIAPMTPLIALSTLSLLGYHLTFDAEMTTPPDMSQFINTFQNGDTTLWNNDEVESYAPYSLPAVPAPAATPYLFQNGALTLSATPVPNNGQPYTSGMLETSGIFSQSGGYFEIRAQTPAAAGFWPAFWLLPTSYYPEIDILEQPNNSGTNTQYWTHTSTPTDTSGGFSNTGVDVTQGFHTYGFLWTPSSIQYVFDGTPVGWPHDLPPALVGLQMYMIANLAVGGQWSWPGQPPAGAASTYTIDYIRAYSTDPAVPAVSLEPISSPDGLDTTPVLHPPAPPVLSVPPPVGAGTDSLVLNMAEDAYQGDAQFSVSIDGKPYGGVLTTQASHASGQTQAFTIRGNFGQAKHQVSVNFLNDFSDPNGDRNLFLTGASLDGRPLVGVSLNLYGGGAQSFAMLGKPVLPVIIGTGPDLLSFSIGETPYTANARFTLSVDGVQQGAGQVASALHGYGQTQAFLVYGAFGPAAHKITLNFLTGAGAAATTVPVVLYVDALSYDGVAVPNAACSFTKSGKYTIQTLPQQADTLTLSLSEDAFQGDAIAQIGIDGQSLGQVSVTASRAAATPQVVSYSGNWGGAAASHVVEVNYLNDAYGGPGADRNLHVQAITFDGAAVTTQPQHIMRNGPVDFSYVAPASAPAGWVSAKAAVPAQGK